MYTEIANNDYYELGIVGDLVCLRFKPAFDQVLGEERGRGCLGTFNEMNIRSQNSPELHDGLLFILGIRRKADSQTASFNPDNPQTNPPMPSMPPCSPTITFSSGKSTNPCSFAACRAALVRGLLIIVIQKLIHHSPFSQST